MIETTLTLFTLMKSFIKLDLERTPGWFIIYFKSHRLEFSKNTWIFSLKIAFPDRAKSPDQSESREAIFLP